MPLLVPNLFLGSLGPLLLIPFVLCITSCEDPQNSKEAKLRKALESEIFTNSLYWGILEDAAKRGDMERVKEIARIVLDDQMPKIKRLEAELGPLGSLQGVDKTIDAARNGKLEGGSSSAPSAPRKFVPRN